MKSKGNAGSAGRRERRESSAEFKAEAVRLAAEPLRQRGGFAKRRHPAHDVAAEHIENHV